MGSRLLRLICFAVLITAVALAATFAPTPAADAGGPVRPSKVYLPLVVRPVPPTPAAPSNLKIVALSTTSIRLTWNDNSTDETRWRIRVPLPGEVWIDQPNVKTYELAGLTPGETYPNFQVQACNGNVCSPFSNAVSITMAGGSGGTKVRFLNESLHYVVSLKIDGVEKLPSSPSAIVTEKYLDFDVAAGNHTYSACTGYWNTSSNPPSRVCFYLYNGSWTQTTGQTTTIPFAHPTIPQVLTDFGTTGAWKSYRIDAQSGVNIDMAFLFRYDGTWEYYESILNPNTFVYSSWSKRSAGTYWEVSRGIPTSKFRIGQLANDEALLADTAGWFWLPNGALENYIYVGSSLPLR